MLIGSLHGKQAWVLRDALKNRQPVRTSGAMRAESNHWCNMPNTGRLNSEEVENLRHDVTTTGVTYVVYSYETPIAWVRSTGGVHLVAQRFSHTTSKHQSVAACYL
jgi:hypothetical protein